MGWMIFEALAAGGVLVFIVWWTMFSGRRGGEPTGKEQGRDSASGNDDPG